MGASSYIYISLHNINNQVHVHCQYDLVLIDKSLKNTESSLIFTQPRNMNRKWGRRFYLDSEVGRRVEQNIVVVFI